MHRESTGSQLQTTLNQFSPHCVILVQDSTVHDDTVRNGQLPLLADLN